MEVKISSQQEAKLPSGKPFASEPAHSSVGAETTLPTTERILSPQEFTNLISEQAHGDGRKARGLLESAYCGLKAHAPLKDLDLAEEYAKIYEKHGWIHHAEKIRENTDLVVPMDEVREKLRRLDIHMPGQDEGVYKFGKLLADRLNPSLLPEGFNLAAELMLYDLQKGVDGFTQQPIRSSLVGQPAMVYGILRMMIPRIAEATCPPIFDSKVRNIASLVNAAIKKDFEEARTANPPKPIEMDLKEYYRKAQEISDYIMATVNSKKRNPWDGMEDRTEQSINPFYSQIEPNGGLALEMYYSLPNKLCTPLGQLSVGGGGSCSEAAVKEISEKLGLVELVPVKHTTQGTIGPIYSVTKDLEGNPMPLAIFSKRASYHAYEDAMKMWREVKPDARRE